MEKASKSRNLPISDFYTILQQEFISYFIRSKIYPEPYASKYAQYCERKKEKIEMIGLKNALPSIFTSNTIKEKYLGRFFNQYGMPNFEYRDEKSIQMMGYWDKVYYFSKGTTVRLEYGGEPTTVIVAENLPNEKKVILKMDPLKVPFSYSEVTRLITDSLINF